LRSPDWVRKPQSPDSSAVAIVKSGLCHSLKPCHSSPVISGDLLVISSAKHLSFRGTKLRAQKTCHSEKRSDEEPAVRLQRGKAGFPPASIPSMRFSCPAA
jgi:hypothetical protein